MFSVNFVFSLSIYYLLTDINRTICLENDFCEITWYLNQKYRTSNAKQPEFTPEEDTFINAMLAMGIDFLFFPKLSRFFMQRFLKGLLALLFH